MIEFPFRNLFMSGVKYVCGPKKGLQFKVCTTDELKGEIQGQRKVKDHERENSNWEFYLHVSNR